MSLRAKLFIMTILITGISLSSVIYLEIDYIKKILTSYYNTRLLEVSKSVSKSIDQNIDIALSQHAGAFTMLLNAEETQRKSTADRYVATNPNISHLSIALKNKNPLTGEVKVNTIVDTGAYFNKINSEVELDKLSSDLRKLLTIDGERKFLLTSTNILNETSELLFVTLYDLEKIIPAVTWETTKKSFVIHSDFSLLSNHSAKEKEFAESVLTSEVRKISEIGGISGIKEFKNSLLAYSTSPSYPVKVFVWNSLDQIGAIVKKETLRQIALVIFILSITMLGVFYFANGFTRNIRKIAHRMELAAKGDMDTELVLNSNDEIGKSLQKLLIG